MPWCPECKIEFREGFKSCNDCGALLVDELPVEADEIQPEVEEAFLITADNALQADILESKLKFYGIPVMAKYRKSGGYLKVFMGATPFGVDLYVPKCSLEIAKELISADPLSDVDIENTNDIEEIEYQNKMNLTKNKRARTLLYWIVVIPGLIVLAINLIRNAIE